MQYGRPGGIRRAFGSSWVASLALVLAAVPSTRQWTASYTNTYQVRVPRGDTREIVFPLPAAMAGSDRPMTVSWTIIRPSPPPVMIALEQCPQPDVCRPMVFRPTGQLAGTTSMRLRVTNRSRADLEIQFRYAVWTDR